MCLAEHEPGGPHQCGNDCGNRAAAAESAAVAAEWNQSALDAELAAITSAEPADAATLIARRPDLAESINAMHQQGTQMTLTTRLTDTQGRPLLVVLNTDVADPPSEPNAADAAYDRDTQIAAAEPERIVDGIAHFPYVRANSGSGRISIQIHELVGGDDAIDLAAQLRGATRWMDDASDHDSEAMPDPPNEPDRVDRDRDGTTTTWPSGVRIYTDRRGQSTCSLPRAPHAGFTTEQVQQLRGDIIAAGRKMDEDFDRYVERLTEDDWD